MYSITNQKYYELLNTINTILFLNKITFLVIWRGDVYWHHHANNTKENHNGREERRKGVLEVGKEGDEDLNSMGSSADTGHN